MLGGQPQLVELGPHVGVELLTEVAWKVRCTDEAEDVGEVLKPVGRGHARGELHLDEAVKRDDSIPRAGDGGIAGIGKCNRLGLSIAREVTREEEVDLDVVDAALWTPPSPMK
jgi:hypothetical protein